MLPEKVLLDIAGKPMLQHVWEQCRASVAETVVIATDSERVRAIAAGFGADVRMTPATCRSGTERAFGIMNQFSRATHLLTVQADEPLIQPPQLNWLLDLLPTHEHCVLTAGFEFSERERLENPNLVKVVRQRSGLALYFSRAAIPFVRSKAPRFLGHLGIYGFSTSMIGRLADLPPATLELAEGLEQLRWLEAGVPVHVELVEEWGPSVDTAADLAAVRLLLGSQADAECVPPSKDDLPGVAKLIDPPIQ